MEIDSFLGATVQRTRYDEKKKLVLQDDSADRPATTVISGLNILTNNQVRIIVSIPGQQRSDMDSQINLVSSTLTAIIVGYLA